MASRFHAYVHHQGQLTAADHEGQRQLEERYSRAQDGLYSRDSEVQAVLDGAHPPAAPQHLPEHLPEHDADPPAADTDADASASGHSRRWCAAGPPPRLERASATSDARSNTTGTSDADDQIQLVGPEDDQPVRRFVTRTSSFGREEFEQLLQHRGLFNVAPGADDPRAQKTHLPPNKLEPPATRGIGRARRTRYLSVLRLPMLRPDNSWVMLWSTLVLLSDLSYSAFVVPISIGMWTSFFEANWTTVCDFLFGAIFFADVFVSLHVGFIATYNTRKLLVMNGRLVARRYLLSFGFLVDACASGAWFAQIVMIAMYYSIESFNPKTALVVMEGIRLLRFLRVVRLLSQLISNGIYATLALESRWLRWLRNQNLLSFCYLMYIIAVVVNFLGCLWNFAAGAEGWSDSWVNYYAPFVRAYAGDDAVYLTSDEAELISRPWLWLTGCYWALTTVATVGYGDVTAANAVEEVIAMAVMVIGVLFFGLVVSSISELLQQANRKARRVNMFRAKMQSVDRWMELQRLPRRLQRRIKTFYAEVWVRQNEDKEGTVLFQELPHALRNEVAWQACRRKLRAMPLLAELDDKTLYLLASKMTPFRFSPGHDLVTEGDPADRFWLLLDGEVVALYHYHEAERLQAPAVVGESVLLQEHYSEALRFYPCTYRTLSGCSCWMVRCRDFKPMLRPAAQRLVKARALQSLADLVSRFPAMWEGREFQRLRTHMEAMPRSASENALRGHDGEHAAGGAAGGAAARGRLARASAPLAVRAAGGSWAGGEPARSRSPPRVGRLGSGGSGDERQLRFSDSTQLGNGELLGTAAAGDGAAAVSAARSVAALQQQQQQPAATAPLGGPPPLGRQSGALPPLPEGQQVVAGVPGLPPFPPLEQGGVPTATQPAAGGDEQLQQQAAGAEGDGGEGGLHSVVVVGEQGGAPPPKGLTFGAAALAAAAAAGARRGLRGLASLQPTRSVDADQLLEREAAEAEAEASAASAAAVVGQGGGGGDGGDMARMRTHTAMQLLDSTAEEREREGAAAAAAAAQAELLAAVLREVQGLRHELDAVRLAPGAPPPPPA